MNVNCNRDPLTCRCEYHSGRVRFDEPLRPPLQTGVQIDDPDPLGVYVAPVVLRLVGRWVGALAMVVGAAAIMYAEGQRQPAPGVGFGIALGLLMGAALLLPLGRSNDG